MQSIGDYMKKNAAGAAASGNQDALRQQVLAAPKVRQFIDEHRDKITPEMIDKSMSSLYEFYSQQHRQDPVTAGYRPQLILNGNAIDLQYVPDASKLARDHELMVKQNVQLINLPKSLHDVNLSKLET
ncbi:primosomal protein DnaI, partial [Lactobacillus sp. XV13L]|nr:primosomal protein DnaI [Lactobacillus sp. XV13L]